MSIDRENIDLTNNTTSLNVSLINDWISQINNLKDFTSNATNEILDLEPEDGIELIQYIENFNESVVNFDCTINIPTGLTTLTSPIILNGQSSKQLTLKGRELKTKTISNIFSSSGSNKNWSVTYTLNNVTDINTGDFVYIEPSNTGSNMGEYYAHKGVWEITNVNVGNNRITVKNTFNGGVFPSSTISSGNAKVFSSVLKFNNSDGLNISMNGLGALEDIVIVGDFNVTTLSGNIKNGVTIGNFNSLEYGNSSLLMKGVVGICNFGGQGLSVSTDCYLKANDLSTNSNGLNGLVMTSTRSRIEALSCNANLQTGLQVSSSSTCVLDDLATCGNGENGLLVTDGSQLQSEETYAYNNSQNGVKVDNQSFAGVVGSKVTNNGGNGILVSLDSLVKATNSEIRYNATNGVLCFKSSVVDVSSSIISNNSDYGLESLDHSTVYSEDATLSSNGDGDYFANENSKIVGANGNAISGIKVNSLSLTTYENDNGISITGNSSSGGVLSKVVEGVSTEVLGITDSGVLLPKNATCALGSNGSEFLIAYLKSLVMGDANKISINSGLGSPEGSQSGNPGSVYFRTGGIEPRTFIKKSGTGNTGWIIMGAQPGDLKMSAVSSDESGWLFCDGRSLNRTTYSDLFAKIGTTFGSTSSTTFNIPDMRATTPVGVDPGLVTGRINSGSTNGANVSSVGGRFGTQSETLTTSQIPSHSHGPIENVSFGLNSSSNPESNIVRKGSAPANKDSFDGSNSGSTGGGQSHNNVQPSIALAFLIKI